MSETFTVCLERDYGLKERLAEAAPDLDVHVLFEDGDDYRTLTPDDLRGVDVLVSYLAPVPPETVAELDDLKLIARLGAGYDNVDLDACAEHGVVVTHAPQGPTEAVAQGTIGLMVVCAQKLRAYDSRIREQGYESRGDTRGFELGRCTIGLIGLGLIGGRVAELLQAFDGNVQVYDPYVSEEHAAEYGVQLVDRDELLETSDIISIHVPRTPETEGMLGADDFRAMKESAYLINTSRGGMYPDAELARAIEEDWIAGGAIDVFEDEPDISNNPLLDVTDDELMLTPHIIGRTQGSVDRILEYTIESVLSVRDGEFPINILNPDVYDEPVPESRLTPSYSDG